MPCKIDREAMAKVHGHGRAAVEGKWEILDLSEQDFKKLVEERSRLVQEQIGGLPTGRAETDELRRSVMDTFGPEEARENVEA